MYPVSMPVFQNSERSDLNIGSSKTEMFEICERSAKPDHLVPFVVEMVKIEPSQSFRLRYTLGFRRIAVKLVLWVSEVLIDAWSPASCTGGGG